MKRENSIQTANGPAWSETSAPGLLALIGAAAFVKLAIFPVGLTIQATSDQALWLAAAALLGFIVGWIAGE